VLPDIADQKRALRSDLRQARATRRASIGGAGSVGAKLLAAARAAGLLDPQGHPGRAGATTVAAYLAMAGEPDPARLTEAVRAAGGRVLLPRPIAGWGMEWALDDGSRGAAAAPVRVPVPLSPTVGTGAAGLVAAGVRVLFLPALAVDESGHRLGQGGGYYDRLLAELIAVRPPEGTRPLLVALVHDEELLPAGRIPVDALDQHIDAALTPSGLRILQPRAAASGG
jgi:5-formyltetrahydrofolate cyclo-ligase